MNETDHEPSDQNDFQNTHNPSIQPQGDPKPVGKRSLWLVLLFSLINAGLPFVYCGSFKLGLKFAIFTALVFPLSVTLAIVFPTFSSLILLVIFVILVDLLILVYAMRYAMAKNRETSPVYFKVRSRMILFLILVVIVEILSSEAIERSLIQAYKVPAGSMEKTLLVGDYFIADKFSFGARLPIPFVNLKLPARQEPIVDDILIFLVPYDPDIVYLKRCIAIEGQSVEIIDKQLFVDDKLMPLPPGAMHSDINLFPHSDAVVDRTSAKRRYLEYIGNRDNMPRIVIPEGQLFVMGDNRDNSYDSRFWGCLDRSAVLGKAVMIHWSWAPFDPCDSSAAFPRPPETSISRPWTYFRCLVFNACHFYERIRWSRIGMKLS